MALRRYLMSTIITILFASGAIAAEQYDPANFYAHLDSVYSLEDDNLVDYLAADIEAFIHAHPNHDKAPDALLMLARLWEDRGKERDALLRFAQVQFLYPSSEAAALAREGRDRMLSEIGDYPPTVLHLPDDGSVGESRADRRFAFLQAVYSIEDDHLSEWLQDQLHLFMADYPDYERIETVYRWSAGVYALDRDRHEARAAYQRYSALFPNDDNLPLVKTRLAVVLEEQFGDEDEAYDAYGKVVTNWPESEHSAYALIRRAELAEDDRRDYRAAIDDYRLLITKWPRHEHAKEALYKIARIKQEKLGAHISAIETYNEFVRNYPDDSRAIEALKQSSEIYARQLDDHASAARQLARIGREYPEHPDAIPMLLEASEIAVDKLDDWDLAIEFLRDITEQFRNQPEARQAQLRINKLMIAKTEEERGK
ncbi:tetratricopeptide repeat protein [candidate division GN15 bacterium]|nr:tetratricopeptide repeat protein [candidate division GN15 bacterium]